MPLFNVRQKHKFESEIEIKNRENNKNAIFELKYRISTIWLKLVGSIYLTFSRDQDSTEFSIVSSLIKQSLQTGLIAETSNVSQEPTAFRNALLRLC